MPPAARITDMHTCPMVNPGPVPHVGGPIVKGYPTVLTGKLPQARITDMAICVGPPDMIAKGAFTVHVGKQPAARMGDMTVHGGVIVTGFPSVLIGDAGSGSAGNAGAGAGITSMTPECAALARAHDDALMAQHTYAENPALPDGVRVVTDPAELSNLGLTPQELDPPNSDFRAEVFARDTPNGTEYTVGFRGTRPSSLGDWASNARQGVGLPSDHYDRATSIGRTAARNNPNVRFVGHSLGGGMASAAAASTGNPATTFNAAGLSSDTVGGYPDPAAPVDAYYTPNDPLSGLQDNRGKVLTGITAVVTAVAGPLAGGALAGFLLGREFLGRSVMPQAYGTRHELPETGPLGNSSNPITPHGMDAVLEAIEAQQAAAGCL